MSTIPYVIEQTSRGERSYDILQIFLYSKHCGSPPLHFYDKL